MGKYCSYLLREIITSENYYPYLLFEAATIYFSNPVQFYTKHFGGNR